MRELCIPVIYRLFRALDVPVRLDRLKLQRACDGTARSRLLNSVICPGFLSTVEVGIGAVIGQPSTVQRFQCGRLFRVSIAGLIFVLIAEKAGCSASTIRRFEVFKRFGFT